MLANLTYGDLGLLAVAGYIAVTSLVRLMVLHRDHLLAKFRKEFEAEKKRKQAEQRRKSHAREVQPPQAA